MPKLRLEEHRATASDLHTARERLQKLLTAERFVPKTSRAGRLAMAALLKIDQLRSELDDIVCRDFPELERPERVYYDSAKRRRGQK